MARAIVAALAIAFAAFSFKAWSEEVSDEQLEQLLEKPGATGLIILGLAPKSQAQEKGLQRGDIVTAYNGMPVPDVETLREAIQKAVDAKLEKIPLTVARTGKERTVEIGLGPLGVNSLAVTKDKPTQARPPASGIKFDFASLKDKPQEAWYDFMIGGKKVGFEHYLLELKGDHLVLTSETAFDGGEAYPGIQQFVVGLEATATVDPQPYLLKSSFAFPPGKFSSEGIRVSEGQNGKTTWRFKASWVESDEAGKETPKNQEGSCPAPADLLSDYLLVPLAAFMPRKAGACLRFVNLDLGAGEHSDPAALYVKGEEETEVAGEKVKSWCIEQHVWGQVTRKSWVDAQGRVVKNAYGTGAESVLTTKEKALAGLPKGIEPKTVK